jgi:phospholipase/carboxylesterase
MPDECDAVDVLDCIVLPASKTLECVLIFLHGYGMCAQDLVSHCQLLGPHSSIYLPQGPIIETVSKRSWWPVDVERREKQLHIGPRDLANEHPSGRDTVRKELASLVEQIRKHAPGVPIVFGGFSQGGMLACDTLLSGDNEAAIHVDGVALLSACKIAFDEWSPNHARAHGIPVFMSHGRSDKNIQFAAGEALKDWLLASGAEVTWAPFEGGHGMPLHVWRQLREFIHNVPIKRARV